MELFPFLKILILYMYNVECVCSMNNNNTFSVCTPSPKVIYNKNKYERWRIKVDFFIFFLSPKSANGGGGQSLGDISPKKSSFLKVFFDVLPKATGNFIQTYYVKKDSSKF